MKELNRIFADNLSSLRKKHKITQSALAEKLSYSDKAVSKWERAESLPDVAALKQIADIFGVTTDYLLTEEHEEYKTKQREFTKRQKYNRLLISLISVVLVWLVATFIFINIDIFSVEKFSHWLVFLYAVPASMIVTLVFNSVWGNSKFNFLIISVLVWTVLVSFYITFLTFGINIWLVLILGVPAQIIIILWSRIRLK